MINFLSNRIKYLKQTGNYPIAVLNALERKMLRTTSKTGYLPEYFIVYNDVSVASIKHTLQALYIDVKYVQIYAPEGKDSPKKQIFISKYGYESVKYIYEFLNDYENL